MDLREIKVSGLNHDLIEKIELLIQGQCPPRMIAKALHLDTNKVKEYIQAKKDLEREEKERLKEQQKEQERAKREVGLESTFTKASRKRWSKHKYEIDVTQDSDNIDRMRYLRSLGHSPYKIALTFGTSYNRVWPHIRDIQPKETIRQPRIILSKEDIREIQHLYSKGFTDDQISRFLGVTEITVSNQLAKKK